MTFSQLPRSTPPTLPPAARPSVDAFFSYGFRPFFLGAGIYAALAMAVWIAWLAATIMGGPQDWLPIAGSPFAWHAHEMVFGFAAAAIGGFLLTAVPNWTGALPLSGLPLVLLFATWLLGRLAMGLSAGLPYPLVIAIDVLYLPLLGAMAARQLFVRPALLKWMGAQDFESARFPAITTTALHNDGDRPHYLRGVLKNGHFTVTGLQQSHALFALSQANALLRLEPGQQVAAGSAVEVLL